MSARIDTGQNFSEMWELPNQKNETGYSDHSLEAKYWPIYREFYNMMRTHAEIKDISGLRWHCNMMRLAKDKIMELIAEIEADADNVEIL